MNEFEEKVKEENKAKAFYNDKVGRKISAAISKQLVKTPITANQVSLLMILVGWISAFLFCFGEYKLSVIGACLLFLHHTLDAVDGEVARYKNQTSLRGKYLDVIAHYITEPLLFLGITIGVVVHIIKYIGTQSLVEIPLISIVVPVGYVLLTFMLLGAICMFSMMIINVSYLAKKYVISEHIAKTGTYEKLERTDTPPSFLAKIYRKTVGIFFRWPEYHFVILFMAIFDLLPLLLLIYAIGFSGIAVLRLYTEFKDIPLNYGEIKIRW